MKKKVVMFSKIFPEFEEKLRAEFEVVGIDPKQGSRTQQLQEAVVDAHGLIGAGVYLGEKQLATGKHLEIISSVSVGYDNYDLAYLAQQGIKLAHTPHVLTETTADMAFSLLMAAARRVTELDAWIRAGQWQRSIKPSQFGQDVYGKTLGIVGLGHIGAAIARRGYHGFNMSIKYHSRQPKPEIANALVAEYMSLPTLLQTCDYVVLSVALSDATTGMIGEEELAMLQPHAILVNIARGAVIDETALYDALKNQQFAGAGLDVFVKEPLATSPLFTLDNVVLAPHIGSATLDTRYAMHALAYQNLVNQLNGQTARYLVDLAS